MKKWNVLKKGVAFENKWRQVDVWDVTQPNGEDAKFYFTIESDVVIICARTESGDIVMIDQYHIYFDEYHMQLPAGYIDAGYKPLESAKKELREETGFEADSWQLMGKVHISRWHNNYAYYYFADNARHVGAQVLEPAEDIEVKLVSQNEFENLINSGKIENGISLTGALLASRYLNSL